MSEALARMFGRELAERHWLGHGSKWICTDHGEAGCIVWKSTVFEECSKEAFVRIGLLSTTYILSSNYEVW